MGSRAVLSDGFAEHLEFITVVCMNGPLILGSIGAGLVLLSALTNLLLVRAKSPRYHLELSNAYDGGTDFVRLVRDLSLINGVLVVGASVQLIALIWQATSS